MTVAVTVRRTACRESACDEDALRPQMSNCGLTTGYLITYSQADCTRFSARDEFASIVLTAFNVTKKKDNLILYNGFSVKKITLQVVHIISMPVKLSHARRWLECMKLFG